MDPIMAQHIERTPGSWWRPPSTAPAGDSPCGDRVLPPTSAEHRGDASGVDPHLGGADPGGDGKSRGVSV